MELVNFGLKDVLDLAEMEVTMTFFLRRRQDVFQETSSRLLLGDVLKTSLRRLKTSRLFLVRAKDHLETIPGLSICVRFKLLTCYHSSLDKLIELI